MTAYDSGKTYRMFAGGSIDGIYSRTTYPTPTTPTNVPGTMRNHFSPTITEPIKM